MTTVNMKVDIQEISSVKRAIRIEISKDVVADETSRAYRNLNQRVRWPGFRKGKTPLALLEKRYADTVRDDLLKKLIPDYYQKALEQTGITPVDYPAFEKIEIAKDAPLSFTALVEVKPAVELGDYQEIPLENRERPVTAEDIQAAVEQLRSAHAQLEASPDDHPVASGDVAIIDYEGMIDGRAFEGGKAENYLVELGSEKLLPGIENQMIGKKKGDRLEVETTFPADHRDSRLAGKTAVLAVTVREVKIKRLPEADDEFAKDIGPFESMEDLQKKIRNDMEAHAHREARRAYHDAVIKHLVANHAFEVPASLVEREVHAMVRQLDQRIRELGKTVKDIDHDAETLRREMEPRARERVAGRLILESIAKKENIQVGDDDVENELDRLASGMKVPKAEFRQYLMRQEGSLEGIRAGLREDKVLDLIVSRAALVEPAK